MAFITLVLSDRPILEFAMEYVHLDLTKVFLKYDIRKSLQDFSFVWYFKYILNRYCQYTKEDMVEITHDLIQAIPPCPSLPPCPMLRSGIRR